MDIDALVHASERAIRDTHALKHRIETVTQRGQRNNQITRSYFYSAIDNELQEDHSRKFPTALYYIGLDLQENYYKEYGPAGVAALHEQFCQRIAQTIGSEEQWTDISNQVACVLVGKRNREQHLQRANQIAANLSSSVYNLGEDVFVINAHVGVHFLDAESGSANTALEHAEQAYERAKQSVAPLPIVEEEEPYPAEPELPPMDFSERLPEEHLRIAYQPMISLEQPNIEHYEALVRWHSDDEELIPAAKFLHYIEHSNMRLSLDRWVLQSSVGAIITDNYARENASLFIHLSDETMAQKSFFSFAANVLRSSRLRGQRRLIFIFEEKWVFKHLADAGELINSLHNIQCGACLSHAGSTAYSEKIIEQIEFDYVRLAPTLTSQFDGDAEKESNLLKIIAAAKKIDAQIIATQVEDSKNLSTLWLHGVRLFQGFLLQSPDQSIHSHNDMETLKQFFSPVG